MLEIANLILPVEHTEEDLRAATAHRLNIPVERIESWLIWQKAIDARGFDRVNFVYTLHVGISDESAFLTTSPPLPHVRANPDYAYREGDGLPAHFSQPRRPLVVGTGPAGLFCALLLARHGWKPLVFERGKQAGPRARDVTGFWRRGWDFDPESNVQYGEGGAGTFSDGKLYTRVKDRENRIPWLLQELVKAGAPEEILTNSRPHIGTDRLIKVVRHIREEIIGLGGEFHWESRIDDVRIENGRMTAIMTQAGHWYESDHIIMAIGHSARDTFAMLHRHGVPMEKKPFSIGARIEHPQEWIDRHQYGRYAGHPLLGAAPYKFAWHNKKGRGVYSFCMCPGGLVVAAASEPDTVVTNGMSSFTRAEANANAGFMVDLKPEEIPGDSPLAGIAFQRIWEKKAFALGGGGYLAPAQLLGDLLSKRASTGPGRVKPSYEPGVVWTDLRECLPEFVIDALRESVKPLGQQLRGFAMDEAVLTGVETRSSSPLRIPRDPETRECLGVSGFYPAGEGAGYAGGIISAAADGMKVAEGILRSPQVKKS